MIKLFMNKNVRSLLKYAHYSQFFFAGKIEQLKVQLMEPIGIFIDYLFCASCHILQLVTNGVHTAVSDYSRQ